MKQLSERIKEAAFGSLSSGQVEMVIGWQKGPLWWQSFPAFITDPGETASLIWDPFSVSNLNKYLLNEVPKKKIALFLKGCDALGFNQLLRDGRVEREKVLLFGIPCDGLVDPARVEATGLSKGLLQVKKEREELVFYYKEGQRKAPARDFYYSKCLSCRYPNPVTCDEMLGEAVPCQPLERFANVSKLEAASLEERFTYWSRHFSRCIRCFACRNVCPACSCRECIFDIAEPRWLGKAKESGETLFYHITRAYHVAGRCVDCGECARICPLGIPLAELNRKFIKDINELYGEYDAGADLDKEAPLLTFKSDDPDVSA
jgi:ferredoxin